MSKKRLTDSGKLRIRRDPEDAPEDIVLAHNDTSAHIERMTEKHVWIRLEVGPLSSVFHLTSRSPIHITEE